MPIAPAHPKTCPGCGFIRTDCHCGRKKNSSGEYTAYQNYRDFRESADFAMTARINRSSADERKLMDELMPIDGEELSTFIKRTEIAESKIIEHSINHHLYGTKRVWSCHTSSRYCFICTLCQYVEIHRAILMTTPLDKKLRIQVQQQVDKPPLISTYLQ